MAKKLPRAGTELPKNVKSPPKPPKLPKRFKPGSELVKIVK
ncbi:MAG: hypothetical protein WCK09_18230 [Bacteroidota bacterium]